jgi:hypothetical protein
LGSGKKSPYLRRPEQHLAFSNDAIPLFDASSITELNDAALDVAEALIVVMV